MNLMNNNYLKLAIQKEGRLTDETLAFLRTSGFEFESYKQRLLSLCWNFPLEVLYVRDDDIPDYVASGTVDLGILGQNLLYEDRPKVKKLLNLRFGFCRLVLAIPRDSMIKDIRDLDGKKVATTYPKSTKIFFEKNKVKIKIITINGSVEITPILGIADAIVDLVSTGSTLALNELKVISEIFNSEAVLITNSKTMENEKKEILDKLLIRLKAALSAKNYKYVMMNAKENILPKLKKIIPGLKLPTISSCILPGWVSVQGVLKEDVFWETINRLKKEGTKEIIVLPIEKMII